MTFRQKIAELYFAVLRGMKDDVDRALWAVNPALPRQIHADSFKKDGVHLDMFAQRNPDGNYCVLRYTGRRFFGPIFRSVAEKPDAKSVDIRNAIRLLHEWNKARVKEGFKPTPEPVAGSGPHYRVIAQKLEMPLF